MNPQLLDTIIERWKTGDLQPTQLRRIYGLNDTQTIAVVELAENNWPGVTVAQLLSHWDALRPGLRGAEARRVVGG